MSSTKRYKQPSENSNRFQDIPPRFKRQKSINSQKLHSAMESTHQLNHPSQKNKKQWGDPMSSNGSFTTAQKGSQLPREGRKIVKKLSTQKAQQNAEKALLKPPTQPFVLSPMENKLFSLVRNDEFENPQISASNVNQSRAVNSNSYPQPAVPLCDSFTNNSNIHHHSAVPFKPDPYGWVGNHQMTNQFNSPEQRISPSPSVSSHRSTHNESPSTNYSDPDIRTIEMLRELERVADQTDVGSEESNNDKNSLVSHHLRMLMCAVDRYTQGVDEMGSDSHEDEPLPQETPRRIPSPPQNHIKDFSQHQEFSDTDSAFSDDYYYSPSKPVDQYTTATTHQAQLNTWNPWSTPSFNALDVYTVASSSNANHHNNNNYHHASHPSMFMFDNNMCYGRDSF